MSPVHLLSTSCIPGLTSHSGTVVLNKASTLLMLKEGVDNLASSLLLPQVNRCWPLWGPQKPLPESQIEEAWSRGTRFTLWPHSSIGAQQRAVVVLWHQQGVPRFLGRAVRVSCACLDFLRWSAVPCWLGSRSPEVLTCGSLAHVGGRFQ